VEESLRPQGVDAAVLGVAGARQGPLRLFFLLPEGRRHLPVIELTRAA
jgi:hypothetical protein